MTTDNKLSLGLLAGQGVLIYYIGRMVKAMENLIDDIYDMEMEKEELDEDNWWRE